jgi:pimeloyl-ACP methyl ester carboxylesterase
MLAMSSPAILLSAGIASAGIAGLALHLSRRAPRRLSERELSARTAPGAISAGAEWAVIEGAPVSWWEFGDRQGVPLIALHGLGITGLSFLDQDALFRSHRVRCIAPNLMGGLADPHPDARIVDLSATVLRLADHLGLSRFMLASVSWGTLPLLGVTALAPERVERAALFGAFLHGRWCAEDPATTAGLHTDNRRVMAVGRRWPWLLYPWMRVFGLLPPDTFMRRFCDARLPAAERATVQPGHPFHDAFARAWRECAQRGYFYLALGSDMATGRDPGFSLAEVDAGGVELWCETGELDNVHTPAMGEYLRRHVRRCETHTVEGQGRLGCTGSSLEAGLARFLAAAPDERQPY